MWILNPVESGGAAHYLLPNKDYVVGRKNCDVLLPSDQSISRAHAHLHASHETLTVKDSSKYGTFVNGERLTGDAPRSLKTGDRVTFGVFHSQFSVEQQGVLVCSSCLDGEGKAALSHALLPLGGQVVNSWTRDCTHLVMPAVKVTIKTICALLSCRPIVKQEYFTELSRALQQKLPVPKAESFLPDVDEPSLSKEDLDLSPRPERKRLFSGKTFLFLSAKQLKRLSSAVTLGGGRSQLLEEGSLPSSLLESPSSCVVDVATGNSQALSPATRKWAESVGKILQKKALRFITESEIGLAAIYVTCDKYCNPTNQLGDSESAGVKPAIPSATLSQNAAVDETVLPVATQNITAYVVNTETSQRVDLSGVSVVGETPERSQSRGRPGPPRPPTGTGAQAVTSSVHAVTSSLRATKSAGGSEGKGAGPELPGGGKGEGCAPRPLKQQSSQKGSPLKQQPSQKGSPLKKQSAMTSFFQPVDKKRPREEESSPVESEPKRATHNAQTASSTHTAGATAPSLSTAASQPRTTTRTSNRTSTSTKTSTRTQSQLGSGADLFPGHSDGVSRPAQQGLQTRKRKEREQEEGEEEEPRAVRALGMEMEELESIMSEEMDDEVMTRSLPEVPPLMERSSTNQTQPPETPANKKQCLANQKERSDPEEGCSTNRNQPAVKDEEVSFMEASKPLNGVLCVPEAQQESNPLPAKAKQETPGSEAEDDLPSRLVLVEFKSLIIRTSRTIRSRPGNQEMDGRTQGKNFKRFNKVPVPGCEGLPNIIGGSDLLAHSRGKTSELEEWLRDAAQEERQEKQDESVGDDLFRYDPKPLKRSRALKS